MLDQKKNLLPEFDDDDFDAMSFKVSITDLKRYLESDPDNRKRFSPDRLESGIEFVDNCVKSGRKYIKITKEAELSGKLVPDVNALKAGIVLNRAFDLRGVEAERLELMEGKINRMRRWLDNFRSRQGQSNIMDEASVRRLVDYAHQYPLLIIKPWSELGLH